MSGNPNSYTASLRAPEGYHLPKAMNTIQERFGVFDKFGGHPCAAGFTVLAKESLEVAKVEMAKELELQAVNMSQNNVNYNANLQNLPDDLVPFQFRKEILWIEESKVDSELLNQIMSMDPFGQDFMLPNLAFEVMPSTLSNLKWLGSEQKHLKLTSVNGICLTFFNLEPELKNYFLNPKKTALWIITKPIQNCWMNKRTIELVVDKWFIGD
jgi:single-stranded DNA-specific DHH superfamily exonuclease